MNMLRAQLAENGATGAEIDILLNARVELNAMTSAALIEMIERKLKDYGLEKVIPPNEELLVKTYRAFHRSPNCGRSSRKSRMSSTRRAEKSRSRKI